MMGTPVSPLQKLLHVPLSFSEYWDQDKPRPLGDWVIGSTICIGLQKRAVLWDAYLFAATRSTS